MIQNLISHNKVMAEISVTFLTWRRFLQRTLLPFGITLKQLFVLRQLEKKEFLFPSDIAEILFCDRPTATVIIDNLVRQQWINREKDPTNKKYVRITLTENGRAKLAEVKSAHWGEADPLSTFSESEIEQFHHLLQKTKTQIDQIEYQAQNK